MSKIVIGHKVLNLDELCRVSFLDGEMAEVIVDSQLYADLNKQDPTKVATVQDSTQNGLVQLTKQQVRGAILVKLVQILKLKKNASKKTVDVLLAALNNPAAGLEIPAHGTNFGSYVRKCFEVSQVCISEKEVFILEQPAHVIQASFALVCHLCKENVGLYDACLAFGAEMAGAHADYFTDYALTLGKSTAGVSQMRNNVQAMVDGSKLLSSAGTVDRKVHDRLNLGASYRTHQIIHELSSKLASEFSSDLNSDFAALFNEKKYKELAQIATESQHQIIADAICSFKPLQDALNQAKSQCQARLGGQNQSNSNPIEEDCSNALQILLETQTIFGQELSTALNLAKEKEEKAKEKAAKKDDKAKKPKGRAAKAAQDAAANAGPAGAAFGKGSRQLFDFFTATNLMEKYTSDPSKLNLAINKELQMELGEALAVRNQERRLPKCAKGTRDMNPLQMAIREKAFNIIRGVFKKHGASEIDTPVFELKETLTNKYGEDSKLIYDLQDQGGELLALRYDLTVPFARFVAEKKIASIKRYHIAKVYRRDQPQMNKGRFREFYQCDFDIAGDYSLMIPDAEVLSVVTEILRNLELGEFTVKVNHRKFLDAMVELAGCEKRKFKSICSSIDKLDKEPWEKVRLELINQKGLTEEMCAKLHTFVQFQGKPWDLLAQLKESKVFEGHESAMKTIGEMEMLFEYLDGVGATPNILFDFSLARGLDYYTGLIYEAVLTGSDRGSIAGGGRYDHLVGMFSSKDIPAVGVSIGIERVFAILEKKALEEEKEKVRATSTQVLVASIGKKMTGERMRILGELWKSNIAAETLYHDNPKPQKQLDYAFDNGIPLVMWIGEDEVKQGVVKVKSLSYHTEVFVKRADLIPRLQELIQENPVLLSQDQQAAVQSGKKDVSKKQSVQVAPEDLLNKIEAKLVGGAQWLANTKEPSKEDRDTFEQFNATHALNVISATVYPHAFAWWAQVSKFTPETRDQWKK